MAGGMKDSLWGIVVTSNTPRTWADIDFSGCYPTAITLVPKIDLVGTILERKATLVIDAETTSRLLHEGLTPNMVRDLKSALNTSNEAFFLKLFRLKNRRLAGRVRQICERPDNSLIEDWLKRCRVGLLGRCLIAGFAKIRFSFPDEMLFPCLPVSHEKYGLVYPLSGETCVTAAEVVLALEAGAHINCLWAVELPVVVNDDGVPIPLLHRHLREVMCARKEYADRAKDGDAAAVVFERLLKEFANSFYGKFAQGINVKSATDDTTGLSQKMPPSQITEPCVAALATGFARAALSAALLAVDRYNQGRKSQDRIAVASCTTDGLLLGLPPGSDFSVLGEYYQQVPPTDKSTGEVTLETRFAKKPSLAEYLARFACEGLLDRFNEYLPLRLMRQARLDLVEKDDYLEIKHLADFIVAVKTRGQLVF